MFLLKRQQFSSIFINSFNIGFLKVERDYPVIPLIASSLKNKITITITFETFRIKIPVGEPGHYQSDFMTTLFTFINERIQDTSQGRLFGYQGQFFH